MPRSTVHYWAREGVLVPSVSAERRRLWSYADLMGLRLIYWLRHGKRSTEGLEVPAASMPAVRRALDALSQLEQELWTLDRGAAVAVDRAGRVVLNPAGLPETPEGQTMEDVIDLVHPFKTEEGTKGPDLHRPRPHLRIVPGKLAGEPHVARSRIETQALAALARRGMGAGNIARLYPALEAVEIDEAIDLEHQLEQNLSAAA